MDRYALVLTPTGHLSAIEWPDSPTSYLDTLHTAIGCTLVQRVEITDRLTMWVDEEGLSTQPDNLMSTLLVEAFRPAEQVYHGTAVITGGMDTEGTTQPLTPEQIKIVIGRWMSTVEELLLN
ncbi:DUF3846 domain-containing protein [Streptomyces sp. NPDC037389]|uniref:DUF3846 domain-containing protein n=1 Tax=Streptomyces sp. NPDC037389 TaxID=3155369 RepID=UPI0033DA06E2